jgi:septal ring factor EnvC (AmiA/AmiB activator)
MATMKTLGIAVVLAATGALAGCDQSKAELEATKQQLQTVTMERDSLKTELQESKQRAVTLQRQLADIQAKLSAAAAALVPPAEDQKAAPAKVDKKAGDAAKPAAPVKDSKAPPH